MTSRERKYSRVYDTKNTYLEIISDNSGRFAIKSTNEITNETNELFISERGEYFSFYICTNSFARIVSRHSIRYVYLKAKPEAWRIVINRKGKNRRFPPVYLYLGKGYNWD